MVLVAAAAAGTCVAAVSNPATAAMSAAMSAAVTIAAADIEEARASAGWEATRAAELEASFAGCLAS